MTEEEMLETLRENSERIKKAAVDAVVKRVEDQIRYQMPAPIAEAIKDFMENEVAPEAVKSLQSQKGEIIKSVQLAAQQIGEALRVQLVENATKQLSGYRGGEILKKLVDD